MEYADLNEGDMVVMEADTKKIVEGFRKPSVDIDALLHIYHNLAHVNAVIHTHQNYATCIGLVYDRLPSIVTTLANAAGGEIRVAPFSSAASLEMGKMAVAHIGDKKAVILRNHGVVVVGKTLKEAVYSSVYLEDAALIYCVSKSLGKPVVLTEEQTSEAVRIFEHYIQTSLKNS
jgi:L-ribulose-5-phosphate 4-epimerase